VIFRATPWPSIANSRSGHALRHDETTVPPWCYCGMESDAHMNLRALAINEEALRSIEECIKELDECIKKTEDQLHQLESAMGER
jgi:hypothetical protein